MKTKNKEKDKEKQLSKQIYILMIICGFSCNTDSDNYEEISSDNKSIYNNEIMQSDTIKDAIFKPILIPDHTLWQNDYWGERKINNCYPYSDRIWKLYEKSGN